MAAAEEIAPPKKEGPPPPKAEAALAAAPTVVSEAANKLTITGSDGATIEVPADKYRAKVAADIKKFESLLACLKAAK